MLKYYAVAGVAQLVEQLIRNQQVTGSSPVTSSKTVPLFGVGLYFLEKEKIWTYVIFP